jgi:hypothetical protein
LGLDALYFGALSGRRGEEAGGGEFGGGFGVGTESEGGFGEAEAEGEELGVRAGEGPEKIGGRLGLAPFQEDEGKGIGDVGIGGGAADGGVGEAEGAVEIGTGLGEEPGGVVGGDGVIGLEEEDFVVAGEGFRFAADLIEGHGAG